MAPADVTVLAQHLLAQDPHTPRPNNAVDLARKISSSPKRASIQHPAAPSGHVTRHPITTAAAGYLRALAIEHPHPPAPSLTLQASASSVNSVDRGQGSCPHCGAMVEQCEPPLPFFHFDSDYALSQGVDQRDSAVFDRRLPVRGSF